MAIEIICNRGGVIHKVRSRRELAGALKRIVKYQDEKPEWFPLWIENKDGTDLEILFDIEREDDVKNLIAARQKVIEEKKEKEE